MESLQFTNENVPHLLRLAQEHFVPELTALCNGFLEDNFRNLPLQEMLELAVRYNITDLKWHCFIFASRTVRSTILKPFFNSFTILWLLIRLMKEGIRRSYFYFRGRS